MKPEPHAPDASPEGYFSRPAEKLVLEGYRLWTMGIVLRSTAPWTDAQILYRGMLGDEEGARAIVALARFIDTLGRGALSPLSAFRPGSGLIARDEVLVMGLVSSIQHRDRFTQHYCLDRLGVAGHAIDAAASAERFALTLLDLGAVMKPLPARLLGRILNHVAEPPCERVTSPTVH